MFCTGCGASLEAGDRFCRHCGMAIDAAVAPVVQRKQTAPWVILSGLLLLALIFYKVWTGFAYTNLEPTVSAQLEAIRSGNIPAAYFEYTSPQFQAATTLEQFRRFIETNTVFKSNSDAEFETPIIEDKYAVLKGTIRSKEGARALVQYMFQRENDEWKILNIKLDPLPQPNGKEIDVDFDVTAIEQVVQNQLGAIREGRLASGYADFTTTQFREVTSRQDFDAFMTAYTFFGDRTPYTFTGFRVEGNTVTLVAVFQSGEGPVTVEFDLLPEAAGWKVQRIQMMEPR